MGSHHLNHQHHHLQQQLLNPTAAPNCCCWNSCSHQSPQSTEPLLQAIISQLLQQQGGGGTCCQPQTHRTHQEQNFHQQKQNLQCQHQEKIILSSLLSRVDAPEASLHNFSLSSASHKCSSFTLRDIAASVIQTHFRAFLVRRSRTLRQLKELALIKSSFIFLKSSISKKSHFDYLVVSRKAVDLLLILDSIQGFDPMIREGKRSISNDLMKFLQFLDEFHEISCRPAKSVKFVGNRGKSRILRPNCEDSDRDQTEVMNKLRDRIEKIHGFSRIIKRDDEDVELDGFHQLIEEEEKPRISRNKNGVLTKRQILAQPRVRKSVTFAENGNVSSGDGTLTDESVSGDDDGQGTEVEEMKGLPKETEEEGNGESFQSSNVERTPTRSLRSENGDYYKVEDGKFEFSGEDGIKS